LRWGIISVADAIEKTHWCPTCNHTLQKGYTCLINKTCGLEGAYYK